MIFVSTKRDLIFRNESFLSYLVFDDNFYFNITFFNALFCAYNFFTKNFRHFMGRNYLITFGRNLFIPLIPSLNKKIIKFLIYHLNLINTKLEKSSIMRNVFHVTGTLTLTRRWKALYSFAPFKMIDRFLILN